MLQIGKRTSVLQTWRHLQQAVRVCAILGELSSLSCELSLARRDFASRALLTEPKACRNKSAGSMDKEITWDR